ncbi:MAG: hypothetical protein U0P81_06155 [Holophagaceae bacterium]
MSLHTRFERAFTHARTRLRQSHPAVKTVTYHIPSAAGATLRVLVGIVMEGYGEGSWRLETWDVEQVVKEALNEEGLPEPMEVLWAKPEDLGGVMAHRYFFAKVAS